MKIALPNLTLNYVQLTYTSIFYISNLFVLANSIKFSNIFGFSKVSR